MLLRLLVCATLLSVSSLVVQAQARLPRTAAEDRRPPTSDPPPPLGSPQEEMIERAIIKKAESNHKETLERARESAQLGAQLSDSFERNNALDRDDLKKLERIEKLARSIRSRAGGSDDETVLEQPPRDLREGLKRVSKLAEELQKSVEKTSRHVISASVIERSNELIELIRHLRGFSQ
jgi:DUF438 domain-containing protein